MIRRVLLKVSGEALMGDLPFGVSPKATAEVAAKIQALQEQKVEIGLVIGGGNLFRGVQQAVSWGMERTPADQVGMLATLMNGIVLNQALLQAGCQVCMMTALHCPAVAETYQWEQAMRYLSQGSIVLFVGGTGHPYFTTDTCAALRACEIKADLFLKATSRVDGIYDKDPHKESGAKKYTILSFEEILDKKLGILDLTAVTLCMQANISIRVFNFFEGPLVEALSNRPLGTLVTHLAQKSLNGEKK
jgi:uridylate kinase